MAKNRYAAPLIAAAAFLQMMVCSVLLAQIDEAQLKSMIIKDEMLIVPGMGAAGIMIGKTEKDVVLIKGAPPIMTKKIEHDFFKDVLKITSDVLLPFHLLFKYNKPSCFIGIYQGCVSFIVLWGADGILFDGIRLSNGIMPVAFIYGNEGLNVLKEGSHSLYMYKSRGIVFIDEDNNESIDGVIVFKPVQ